MYRSPPVAKAVKSQTQRWVEHVASFNLGRNLFYMIHTFLSAKIGVASYKINVCFRIFTYLILV